MKHSQYDAIKSIPLCKSREPEKNTIHKKKFKRLRHESVNKQLNEYKNSHALFAHSKPILCYAVQTDLKSKTVRLAD